MHSKKFVDINFAPKRKKAFIKLSKEDLKRTFTAGGNGLIVLSILVFFLIFVNNKIWEKLITSKQQELHKLERKIKGINIKISLLRKKQKEFQKRFYDFYVPHLNDLLAAYWIEKKFNRQVLKTTEEFLSIAGGNISYLTVNIFPNPLSGLSDKETVDVDRFLTVKDFGIKKPQKVARIFANPAGEGLNIAQSLAVYIKVPQEDKSFYKKLMQVKDPSLRASIFLEYLLIKYPFNELTKWVKVPITLSYPMDGFFVSNEDFNEKVSELRNFCNYFYLDILITKQKYFNNRSEGKINYEGICIKNIF